MKLLLACLWSSLTTGLLLHGLGGHEDTMLNEEEPLRRDALKAKIAELRLTPLQMEVLVSEDPDHEQQRMRLQQELDGPYHIICELMEEMLVVESQQSRAREARRAGARKVAADPA